MELATATIARPLGDRLIVKRDEADEVTPGGIVLPDSSKELLHRGRVTAVGNGKRLENGSRQPMDVNEGDRIVFGTYAGTEIEIDGEPYVVLREDDVLLVIENT